MIYLYHIVYVFLIFSFKPSLCLVAGHHCGVREGLQGHYDASPTHLVPLLHLLRTLPAASLLLCRNLCLLERWVQVLS